MSDKIKEIVKSKLVEAGITKGFQNAVESYREESLKLQNLRDEQDELVNRFKKSSPKEKEKLKKDLVSMHKKVQSQKKAVDKAESKFNKMVQDEPEELEESKLRKVKVTYDTGDTITTSMAANLSDKKIKDYFKKGKEFNIGTGGKDKMAKVKDVEILENVNETTVAYIKYLNKDKGHKEDIKKFKGKNFYDAGQKAKKWAEKNLDSFNQDMIHYESVEGVNEASMDFYAIKDGKIFRSFPSRKEASIWLKNNGDKYSGVSLRSAKDWERHQQSKNESIDEGILDTFKSLFKKSKNKKDFKDKVKKDSSVSMDDLKKISKGMEFDNDDFAADWFDSDLLDHKINEDVGSMKKDGNTLYVDSDFLNSSNKAGTLKHIGMGDFELDVDGGGTLTFSRVSKKFSGFTGRAHEVRGSEDDIKKMMKKMPKGIGESINEGKPPSPKDVKDWIEGFNNAAWIKTAAGYYLFRASKFALKGIKRELKDSGIQIRSFPKNSYGIPVSQKNDFHWGVNESVNEEYKIDTMGAKKGDWVGVDPHTAEIKKVFKNRGAASRWLNKQSNAEIRPFEDWDKTYGQTIFKEDLDKDSDDPCWDGYVQVGMKKKDGKEVPNCVPIEEVIQANNKIKENMMNENFSKSDVNKIKDIVKNSDSLTKLRDPLKDAGFKNVDFTFSPIPHFMIKKGKSKYIILNKKYAEDPDWTIGKVSGGILEGVTTEGCGECGGTVNESKAKEYKGFKISKGGFQKMWFIIDPPDDMEPYRTTLRDAKKEIDKWLKKHKKDVRESINEFQKSRQLTDPETEMLVVKNGKVITIDKKDWKKYKKLGFQVAESVNESVKPSKTIEKVMDIVDKKSAKKINGTLVDMFTANLIKQVYEMGQDRHKKTLNKMDIHKLADVAFKLARK